MKTFTPYSKESPAGCIFEIEGKDQGAFREFLLGFGIEYRHLEYPAYYIDENEIVWCQESVDNFSQTKGKIARFITEPDWVEHDGGGCPVDGDHSVEVAFRGYETNTDSAELYDWEHHDHPSSIIKYRDWTAFRNGENVEVEQVEEAKRVPEVGVECEYRSWPPASEGEFKWCRPRFIGRRLMICETERHDEEAINMLSHEFRPIKSEREKVIEAAYNALSGDPTQLRRTLESLYDIGALKEPEGDSNE